MIKCGVCHAKSLGLHQRSNVVHKQLSDMVRWTYEKNDIHSSEQNNGGVVRSDMMKCKER